MSVDPEKLRQAMETEIDDFKKNIIEKLQKEEGYTDVIQFIKDYNIRELTPEDYSKRRRVKNAIPFHEKCQAKAANGDQCSRRKKQGSNFCGTHSKACPHGVISMPETDSTVSKNGEKVTKKQIEVWLEDINGIMYWINDSGVVYNPDDINKNIEDPRVIAHYEKKSIDGVDVYRIIGETH